MPAMNAATLKRGAAARAIAPKSPPPALDPLNGPRTDSDGITLAFLNDVDVSPHNPRFGQEPEEIEALAANIERFGLLQSITCHTDPTDNALHYYALNGRRRLAALNLLVKQGRWDSERRIPLRVVEDFEDANGVVLSEEIMRVEMNPADQARTFAKMLACWRAEGETRETTIEKIAKVYGQTTRHIEQRLRLADLHPPILDALSRNKITLDTAKAWTKAPNSEAEEAAWKVLGVHALPADIQRHFEKGALRAGDKLCKFVGEDAYLAAGGQISRDLFGAEGDALWLDAPLVKSLANKKLAEQAESVKAEGWSDIIVAPERKNNLHVAHGVGKSRKPNKDEAARLQALKIDLDDIDKKIEAIENQDGEPSAQQTLQLHDLEERSEALQAEEDRLKASLREFTPKDKAKTRALVTIGDDGQVAIERGIALPRKPMAGPGTANAKKGGPAKAPPAPALEREEHGMLTQAAGEIVGHAVADKPHVALVALAACAARTLLTGSWDQDAPFNARFDRPDKAVKTSAKVRAWQAKLAPYFKAAGALERALHKWSDTELLALVAFAVGLSFNTKEWALDNKRPIQRARAAVFAQLAGVTAERCAAAYPADAKLFEAMNPKAQDEAAKELNVKFLTSQTPKARAAALAAAAVKAKWLHPTMREICGLDGAKPAKKAAPAKPAKKGAAK